MTTRHPDQQIALFRFGRIAHPDAAARAAEARIRAILATIDPADLAAIKAWHGNLVFYNMVSRQENPDISDADVASCEQATLAAFPGMRVADSWRNQSQGIHGVSVALAVANEAPA